MCRPPQKVMLSESVIPQENKYPLTFNKDLHNFLIFTNEPVDKTLYTDFHNFFDLFLLNINKPLDKVQV